MPRERVVLTREDSAVSTQREYARRQRRGFAIIAVGVLFDLAAMLLIVLGHLPAGVAAALVSFLVIPLAVREFTRAARALGP